MQPLYFFTCRQRMMLVRGSSHWDDIRNSAMPRWRGRCRICARHQDRRRSSCQRHARCFLRTYSAACSPVTCSEPFKMLIEAARRLDHRECRHDGRHARSDAGAHRRDERIDLRQKIMKQTIRALARGGGRIPGSSHSSRHGMVDTQIGPTGRKNARDFYDISEKRAKKQLLAGSQGPLMSSRDA